MKKFNTHTLSHSLSKLPLSLSLSLILIPLLILTLPHRGDCQSGIKDSLIAFPLLGVNYGYYFPGADMADRFGNNSMLTGQALYKTRRNLVYGITGGFLFGNEVNEPGLFKAITNSDGYIQGLDGLYAEVRTYQRGYHISATAGKIISWKKPNPNSGVLLMGGVGFLQHKIRIEVVGNTVPQLRNDYLKGYDRLTNGVALHEFIGYIYFSNRQLVNFYAGFEALQGFTEGRRDYNFDDPTNVHDKRLDLLYGFRFGWVIPLYKKKPKAYYFY